MGVFGSDGECDGQYDDDGLLKEDFEDCQGAATLGAAHLGCLFRVPRAGQLAFGTLHFHWTRW